MAFNAERLIEEVRKREILYVSSLRTYKDNAMKEKAWEEVAATASLSASSSNWDVDIRK